jgi:RNA polymerase sigma factor for flagellar operon FliA
MKKKSTAIKNYKTHPSKLTAQQKDKLILEYAPLIKFIAQKIAIRLPAGFLDLFVTKQSF